MRNLHLYTVSIVANLDKDEFKKATVSKKQILSHVWSECHKYLAQNKSHPKVFISDLRDFGKYMKYLYEFGIKVGCRLDKSLIDKLDDQIKEGFELELEEIVEDLLYGDNNYFDNMYLFSDAISLYFKGVNILPHIEDVMGWQQGEWRKYVPVESLKEIKRQVSKTLDKREKK